MADNILGAARTARYDGIPRVVSSAPEVAAVGLTSEQAADRGLATANAEVDLSNAIARPWTYENNPRGHLGVLADIDGRSWSARGRSGRRQASGSTPRRWRCGRRLR
ncbi:MAG: hypothetical protein M3P83_00340 [Actinomycetota bacterium]|nr:hypothetical protein [Actinomycetota bacterium]